MNIVRVVGRFVDQMTQEPLDGMIWFVPKRVQYFKDRYGRSYPAMACHVPLINGVFMVDLSASERGTKIEYDVICKAGRMTITTAGAVPDKDGLVQLNDLIPAHKKFA
jgi:hypothetical protein